MNGSSKETETIAESIPCALGIKQNISHPRGKKKVVSTEHRYNQSNAHGMPARA